MKTAILLWAAALLGACATEAPDTCDPTACISTCAAQGRGVCSGGTCQCFSTGDSGGDTAAGDGDTHGDPGPGDPAPGDLLTGDPTGDPTTGDPTAGDPTAGDPTAGDNPAGDSDMCVVEGGSVSTVQFPGAACCGGLTEIPCAEVNGDLCAFVTDMLCCSYCDGGACGPGENICSCPDDCSTPTCVGEGEMGSSWVPNAECCPGLVTLSCDYDNGSGVCLGITDSFCCSFCGDKDCGPGENPCNCPDDC